MYLFVFCSWVGTIIVGGGAGVVVFQETQNYKVELHVQVMWIGNSYGSFLTQCSLCFIMILNTLEALLQYICYSEKLAGTSFWVLSKVGLNWTEIITLVSKLCYSCGLVISCTL